MSDVSGPAGADIETAIADRLAIRDVIENWAVWRDAGDWDKFGTLWHPEARMATTWFDGSASDFITASRTGRRPMAHHILGGLSIDLRGARAVAQTKMILSVRLRIGDIPCDVECFGRFYDLLEKRNDGWRISVRRCIYEKDRIEPLIPAASLQLDQNVLDQYPEGYRHLAYAQVKAGLKIPTDLPGLDGPALQQLYESGKAWLAGEAESLLPPTGITTAAIQ